jgi:3-dehydroquinate dehydratase II
VRKPVAGSSKPRPERVLVLSGPNLSLLGRREPHIYGTTTLAEIEASLRKLGKELGATVTCKHTSHEGDLVDWLHGVLSERATDGADGVVLNPGGLTHTSVVLRDAVSGIARPVVEVHLTNVHAREEFRHRSLLSPVCVGTVGGFGAESYTLGLRALLGYLRSPARRTP